MSCHRRAVASGLLALLFSLQACSSDSGSSSGSTLPDSGSDAAIQDGGGDGGGSDVQIPTDGSDATVVLTESEPNGGATVQEVNDLPVGASMHGAIQEPGDSDVFRVPTQPGKVYLAKLTVPTGSSLDGHLTVMDDGRNGKTAGDDFVKMSLAGSSTNAGLPFVAMGQGGHYLVVRDARNVQGQSVGGVGFDYSVDIVEADAAEFEAAALAFPASLTETLAQPSGLRLYPFDGASGTDVLIDLKATGDGDFRLFVFSKVQADWIARNDDRALGDADPLIDAPLTASGAMWLIVENVDPAAQSTGYSLSASMP